MWQEFQKRFPSDPFELRQENKKRRAPQVSHNFAVRTPPRQLKQTRFCCPFNNWRLTATLPISTTTAIESRNCPNLSQRQCPPLTGSQKNSNCLSICSKQVWKSTNNSRMNTKKTTSTLSCVVMRYKHSKTSPSLNRENLGEILTLFCGRYVKPQSTATAKHIFQRLAFNPANQKLIDFLEELQKLSKDAFTPWGVKKWRGRGWLKKWGGGVKKWGRGVEEVGEGVEELGGGSLLKKWGWGLKKWGWGV